MLKFRRSRFGLVPCLVLVGLAISAARAANPLPIDLTKDEAKLLKSVYDRDALIHKLVVEQNALSGLNTALSHWAGGPIKLVLQWNGALFKGWGIGNKNLALIEKMATCNDLMGPIIDGSPNQEFFSDLRDVRGCE